MKKFTQIILSILLVSVLLNGSVIAAEEAATAGIADKPVDAKYPLVAEVTANNVFVRAGDGTLWYHTSKAQKGDRVTVVDETPAWAKILPPEGSYSWIHKNYVKVNNTKPTDGAVTGDNVRVWAGSDYMEPLRSNREQTRLNTGDIVELFESQPETGDYYKIKPPAGAHLWISAEYLRYLGSQEQVKSIVIPPRPKVDKKLTVTPGTKKKIPTTTNVNKKITQPVKTVKKTETPVVATKKEAVKKTTVKSTSSSKEFKLTQQCHQLSAQIDAELKKPLEKQSYSAIRKSLEAIVKKPSAGKAATYAKILTERLDRIEMALSVPGKLKQQDTLLQEAREQIAKAHQAKLKNLPKEFDFLYVGVLRPSHVYTETAGQKRYLLLDNNGKIQCYLEASGDSVAAQLAHLVDSTVGIRGSIVNDQKSLVTVVSVNSIEVITQ